MELVIMRLLLPRALRWTGPIRPLVQLLTTVGPFLASELLLGRLQVLPTLYLRA